MFFMLPICIPLKILRFCTIYLQDLIDKARTTLVGNRLSIQRLQASTGVPVTGDSDDPAYNNFNQVIFINADTGYILVEGYSVV